MGRLATTVAPGRVALLLAVLLPAFVAAGAAFVRLAPADPAAWHTDPSTFYQWDFGGADGGGGPWGEVLTLRGGAILRIAPQEGLLQRIDGIAMQTPRTRRLAGSVAQGRITWETRSAVWGFPDYTTAEARTDGVYLYARQRFGRRDLGVNGARLEAWLAEL